MRMTVGGCEANLKRAVSLAEEFDELVADDLDDLLGGRERGKHLAANGFGADVLDELVDDVEVDVGFEQGDANLAQGFADVFFGEGALAAKGFKGPLQFFCEVFKHRSNSSVSRIRLGRIGRTEEANALNSQELWDSALAFVTSGAELLRCRPEPPSSQSGGYIWAGSGRDEFRRRHPRRRPVRNRT